MGSNHDLLVAGLERGRCRVVCFSPRHDLTLARMDPAAIRTVVDAWIDEYTALAAVPWLAYATIFENRGAVMGASNPHPHCQIWATATIPNEPAREEQTLTAYRDRHGACMLCEYLATERAREERLVFEKAEEVLPRFRGEAKLLRARAPVSGRARSGRDTHG